MPTCEWTVNPSAAELGWGRLRISGFQVRRRAKREQVNEFQLKSRPDSGLDCLICAMLARQRFGLRDLLEILDEAATHVDLKLDAHTRRVPLRSSRVPD